MAKTASPKQLAARAKFAAMVRARAAARKGTGKKAKAKSAAEPDEDDKKMKKSTKSKTKSKVHPGFKVVQGMIAKQGYGKKAAGAILASATRKAGQGAKKANPSLAKVKGK